MPWLICCKNRSAKTERGQGKDAQRAESQVADRGVGNQLLHVLLHEGHEAAIDDADDGKGDHPAADLWTHDHCREKRQREADEAVRSHLQQDARQDDGTGSGRLDVRIRQPRVEREHRDLDGEREEEAEEQQGCVGRSVGRVEEDLRRCFVQVRNAERENAGDVVVVEVQEQDAEQHQHGTGERVEEELDGGVELARAAPDADQQVHRDQHRFPEHEEQEEVERHEDAEHAGLQNQEPDVVFLHAVLDGGPGGQNRDPAEQRGQHDQQEGNAVDTDVVACADSGNPVAGRAFDELEGLGRIEALLPEHWDERN